MELELNNQKNNYLENNQKTNNQNMLTNNQEIDLLVTEEATEKNQNKFLESTIGKTINHALDIGLRAVLPDFIENDIINIKDTMLTSGFKKGVDTAIEAAINLGKSALGIVTGKFDNLSQAHSAIKKGGLIDGISEVVDSVLENAQKNNKISANTSRTIRKGKNAILSSISSNIEDLFYEQINSMEKVSKYIENWKGYYEKKDMQGMEKEYQKLKVQLSTVMALENTISEAKKIENVHNLLKNKGTDYELSAEEQELINVLK